MMKQHNTGTTPETIALASLPVDPVRENRLILRDAVTRKLKECEAMLVELIATYPAEKQSSCHPAAGFSFALSQIEKLRKPLARSRV